MNINLKRTRSREDYWRKQFKPNTTERDYTTLEEENITILKQLTDLKTEFQEIENDYSKIVQENVQLKKNNTDLLKENDWMRSIIEDNNEELMLLDSDMN